MDASESWRPPYNRAKFFIEFNLHKYTIDILFFNSDTIMYSRRKQAV